MRATQVVVLGASEGGVEALCDLAAALPAGFPAAILVVLHVGAHKSRLPALLTAAGPLPASHASDGETIRPGHILVAPPDHHLVIGPAGVRLTRGPRENWARPAIDPLFRSAACIYGTSAIGVILTGGLNDGTAGLFAVKQHGGTTIVQDPDGAANPSMPRSAAQHVAIDHCVSLGALPALLVRLVGGRPATESKRPDGKASGQSRSTAMTTTYALDQPVAITCPDCGGALRRTQLGTLAQFRCHIGHVYTAEVMAAAQFEALEIALAAALRALGERAELCRQLADTRQEADDQAGAAQWTVAMDEAVARTEPMRALLEMSWCRPNGT